MGLLELGLTAFFSQQVPIEALASGRVVRVVAVHRSHVRVADGQGEHLVAVGGAAYRGAGDARPTVGDWLLLDEHRERVDAVLERKSVFKRVAAGTPTRPQLIAANVDTLFIVTSCNDEFNESRLERYLALAAAATVTPVVVLTKVDLTDDPAGYASRARQVQRSVPVESVNALDPDSVDTLNAWVPIGSTVALVGSSGVGKSTLINTLLGARAAVTREIRAQDSKGRHTTTHRSIHRLAGGGLLIDAPGMRELKVAELGDAISDVFADIATLARQCRFDDCRHAAEPGCAVRRAVEEGRLDPRRWHNYEKLLHEERRHNRSLAEQRNYERRFAKVVKNMKALRKKLGIKQ